MMLILNKRPHELTFANGVSVGSGATVAMTAEQWSAVALSAQTWLELGYIGVREDAPAEPKAVETTPELDEVSAAELAQDAPAEPASGRRRRGG